MNNGTFSSEQQELLDLLSAELTEVAEFDFSSLNSESHADRVDAVEQFKSQAENIGNAAKLVGLEGFALCCKHMVAQFNSVLENKIILHGGQVELVEAWAPTFLNYLQSFSVGSDTHAATEGLLAYLEHQNWVEALDSTDKAEILAGFASSNIEVSSDDQADFPSEISEDMISLEHASDVRQELLDGLLTELPGQSNEFVDAIDQFIATGIQDFMVAAQRVAHTIKGAANVVGISGVANLMHYMEDLLEKLNKEDGALDDSPDDLSNLLLDGSDCLANMTDYLLGYGPSPDNTGDIMMRIIAWIKVSSEQKVESQIVRGEDKNTLNVLEGGAPSRHESAPTHTGFFDDGLVGSNEPVLLVDEVDDAFKDIDEELEGIVFTEQTVVDGVEIVEEPAPVNRDEDKQEKDGLEIQNQEVLVDSEDEELFDFGADGFDEFGLEAELSTLNEEIIADYGLEQANKEPGKDEPGLEAERFQALSANSMLTEVDRELTSSSENIELDLKSLSVTKVLEDPQKQTLSERALMAGAQKLGEEVKAISNTGEPTVAGEDESLEASSLEYENLKQSNFEKDDLEQGNLENDKAAALSDTAMVKPENRPANHKYKKTAQAQEAAQPRHTLNVPDEMAHELLRLSGETQINNVQLLNRINSISTGVRSADRYHAQIRHLASELEKLVEQQLGQNKSTLEYSEHELDPLELERYNELNSFASQLQELTTDAHEAIAHLDEHLRDLGSIVIDQRNMGLETQSLVMKIRMVPAQVLSSRFMRCVRQASRLTRKAVTLEIEGDDVYIDSRVLNSIVDPVMHLLRNAVDHGIEASSTEREANGKPANGSIKLTFKQEGESVIMRCQDDGLGLDYASIERIAKERGLLNPDIIPTSTELNHVILAAGFSTRDKVSQTSGRGIGLDIVHEQIRQLKGTLIVESKPGVGTTFTMRVPMSVLSAHTLVVECDGSVCSVVSRNLDRIIYVSDGDIERANDKLFYRNSEDDLVPLIKLEELVYPNVEHNKAREYGAILLIQKVDGSLQGVLIEAIKSAEVQVIKPLNEFTYKPEGVVGATILGDGSVSPVVDLLDLPGVRLSEEDFARWIEGRGEEYLTLDQGADPERPMALIVDDSLSARRSLAQFVSDMGMEVKTARDGFEAISVIESKKPALMLVDLEMPRMNGLELTAHIRSHTETRHIPIIMITSRSTDKHKHLARAAGVSGYLSKPWTDDELLVSIQQQIAS